MSTAGRPSLTESYAVLRRAEAARTASRRMIARGERPGYRVEVVRTAPDIAVRIVELPWLSGSAPSMRDVTATGRRLVADWLEVPPGAFDIEVA